MTKAQDQAQLIRGLKANEAVAFRQFIELYQQAIFNLCLRLLNDRAEAEDMTQETFIRAFQAIRSFREEASLNTWLYRIATNLCKNRIAYLSRRKQRSHDHLPVLEAKSGELWQSKATSKPVHDQPEQSLESKEAQTLITQALKQLPEKQRTALTLRDIQGLSYTEIAEITGSSLGTIKSRIHQGRLLLTKTYHALLNGETGAGGAD
ncbi:MAG: hypothetical protein CMH49_02630 [Myxococcales bacterium]|nr:hypothetical protein [Myxococcales bacterium]